MPIEHRAHVLSRVVCLLEPERARVLEVLLIFLRELAKHSDKTLMNAHNLAIVFAPNILRSGTDNPGQVITDAKATLEIVNLLLTDPSITATRIDEVMKPAPKSSKKNSKRDSNGTTSAAVSQKHLEFRKTMQENYQAIRKDSTRKLEQASRKSRISQSEFHKKMEVLSQKILDGEIDPAIFDEAALKFMDPSLIAQFSGQDQSSFSGHRTNRQQRNANRTFAITGTSSAAGGGGGIMENDFGQIISASSPPPPPPPQSHATIHEDDYGYHVESASSDTSDTDTGSGPGSGEIISPRGGAMARTKPSLQRTSSQNSSPIEVGLQRNRSNQLSKATSSNGSTSPSQTIHSPHTAPHSPQLGLGTHRPKGNVEGGTGGSEAAVGPIQEWHRTRHRGSDPTSAIATKSPPLSAKSESAPDSNTASPRQENSQGEEDLDDIMGDLLAPYHAPSEGSGIAIGSPLMKRGDSKSLGHLQQPSANALAAHDSEAATIVTLELLELMLGDQSELPEIVVPAEDIDVVDDETSTNISEEEIVDIAYTPVFPTTGLFSSPLITASIRTAIASQAEDDPSIPSMSDINAILNGE
jgi:hypothetical protein